MKSIVPNFISKTFLFLFLISITFIVSYSQTRIAVLPFQNMDGDLTLNLISYQLQDSLIKSLKASDPEQIHFTIVPPDSIEILLSEMNLDPTNPQYPTDVWKAVAKLNVTKVVTGNFNVRAERFLINAYIYDVETKLAYPNFQARDLFKEREKVLDAIRIIVKKLLPGLQ